VPSEPGAPANFNGRLETDLKRRQEGERVKYRMNGNSAKFYDKAYSEFGSVLRGAETTLNAVQDFRAYRAKEGGPEEDLQWRPMRKGIADLHRRAEVSQKANERLLNALASVDDSRSVEELTAAIQKHTQWRGRRVRALCPWAWTTICLRLSTTGSFSSTAFATGTCRSHCTQIQPNRRPSAEGVHPPSAESSACSGHMDLFKRCPTPTVITSLGPGGRYSSLFSPPHEPAFIN